MSGDHSIATGAKQDEAGAREQKSALLKVMFINAALAAGLFVAGRASDSSALMANALDNLSDATTYSISYFAVSRAVKWKAAAAAITGVMLLMLAAGVLIDAWDRYRTGSEPVGPTMVVMAFLAVGLNYWCIRILRSFQKQDVNLRAAWTMSVNDFASNLGIFVAGGLVFFFGSNWPDLLVGAAIALVAVYGGVTTLRDAYQSWKGSAVKS